MLVFRAFDTKDEPVFSFSMIPRRCEIHPCGGTCSDFYPFCVVRYSPRKPDDGFKRTACYQKGETAWFYVDIPRNNKIQTMRIVNSIVNGQEVSYNVRIVANRLKRSGLQPPEIKHGTAAEFGDEIAYSTWLPPLVEAQKQQVPEEDEGRTDHNDTPPGGGPPRSPC